MQLDTATMVCSLSPPAKRGTGGEGPHATEEQGNSGGPARATFPPQALFLLRRSEKAGGSGSRADQGVGVTSGQRLAPQGPHHSSKHVPMMFLGCSLACSWLFSLSPFCRRLPGGALQTLRDASPAVLLSARVVAGALSPPSSMGTPGTRYKIQTAGGLSRLQGFDQPPPNSVPADYSRVR